ncbi:DNA adenine methylase [Lebetimonas sp. JH292]|uniref:DNA adenine methylase n=1 Tax=Lebetimonas sp. JH292 TaxID=990068 RepID=UPI00046302B3|nr:DNA adenine methylase [Lebetimonas sp. JH292]
MIDLFKINQRRYLGNKTKVLDLIKQVIDENVKNFYSFCDIFAGTGSVGAFFNEENKKIIVNDFLYHNYVSLRAFLSDEKFDEKKILKLIDELNNLSVFEENYFSINFGDKYFCKKNAIKIGAIRKKINNWFLESKINVKEKNILLTSLIYAIDKIANTVGHYDAYIKKEIKEKEFKLKMPDIDLKRNKNNEIYNMDANTLIREIECDILYIDPPYNSRQYSNMYHLLENLALWQKPEVKGVAGKFDTRRLKSGYNQKEAVKFFEDLIKNAKAKYILFSYNNMKDKGHSRSNARISDEDIFRILKQKGKVEVFEKEYRDFRSGKSEINNHKERVFFVEVKHIVGVMELLLLE